MSMNIENVCRFVNTKIYKKTEAYNVILDGVTISRRYAKVDYIMSATCCL